jgi:dipeptidase E
LLKVTFFQTSVLQFFLTPFGIGGIAVIGALLILIALISYFVAAIKAAIKHSQAKTLLLTSAGMAMKEEIKKLLQKPAYDITVAFITTAAKPEENIDYLKRDWDIMTDELGFNLEEVDIDGKKEHEVMELLKLKDIIYVEGGNTFYLLKAMRACHFEKVIRKLLKLGKVYVGVSAGSIVAGKTIKPAVWGGLDRNKNKNTVHLKNFRGLNLVPFDIVVHYDRNPEIAEVIKKKLPFKWQRRKLRILTDEQAILVQGKEVDLIGKGEAMVI